MSSAAQRDETSTPDQPAGTDARSALKQLAAERLAAHRNRRGVVENREAQGRREQVEAQAAIRLQARREAARAEGHPDVSRVRDAVAARYQQSLSYKEFLAAEAQRAIERAQAEAEVAARNAVAVAAAQRELLEEIEQWNEPSPASSGDAEMLFGELPVLEVVEPEEEIAARGALKGAESQRAGRKVRADSNVDFSAADLQVRLPEDAEWMARGESHRVSSARSQGAAEELAELDEEIEFRLAPEFDDLVLETQTIPGNIIEFPRELVAPRKARPRLAEGPLLAEGTPEPQLRIFEVETEQISAEPEGAALAEAPEWQGMLLGAGAGAEPRGISRQLEAQLQLDQQIYAAPVARRLLAAAIDGLCVATGLAGFAAMVVKIAGPALQPMPLPLLGAAVAGISLFFAVIYQLLFFTLNEVTLGMRMMRLAFCTFRENNPSRKAIRRRMISTALAACPLGLGLVWMMLDGDGLGWHDRMSRMYPRAY
ncbi:MAG TPA: RDD family protein [Acidobacteriaceae bacterium]|nr:RDD family protein [Acidobacteriaceae bacterium]